MIYLFNIGFLPVRIWDVLDILIVGYLMYQIYKLLRGNIAFNIFVGVLLLYVVWWLVNQLQMDLLSAVLDRSGTGAVRQVVLLHLSEECNRPDLAVGTAKAALRAADRRASVFAATQAVPLAGLKVAPARRSRAAAPVGFPWEC